MAGLSGTEMARRKSGGKSMKLGGGGRFAAIEAKAAKSGASDPAAVAAVAGRKAHGQKAMTRYSKMGRARKSRGRR